MDCTVETLGNVKHPNIITLVGACSDEENHVIVYEYLPNGSLEDHLNCKNNTSPLSGHARIRIALEISCALLFLHSIPRAHGDLKPDNVLLDSNLVSKLSDFGTCRQLEVSQNTMTPSHLTAYVKGTMRYCDPDYLSSGVITPRFDVYSFGVLLLRLATGKSDCVEIGKSKISIRELAYTAMDEGNFDELMDASIEWPSKEAPKKLAELGLKCFETLKRLRPNAAGLFKSLMDIASNNK